MDIDLRVSWVDYISLNVILRLKKGVCGSSFPCNLPDSYKWFLESPPRIMMMDSSTTALLMLADERGLLTDSMVLASSRELNRDLFCGSGLYIICLTILPCSFFCLILAYFSFLKEFIFECEDALRICEVWGLGWGSLRESMEAQGRGWVLGSEEGQSRRRVADIIYNM